jgi:hypothetical protein
MPLMTYLLLKALRGVAEKVRDMAKEEYYGEDTIKQRLLELQMRLEMDEITEEEYLEAEAALMKRLEEGRRDKGEDEV